MSVETLSKPDVKIVSTSPKRLELEIAGGGEVRSVFDIVQATCLKAAAMGRDTSPAIAFSDVSIKQFREDLKPPYSVTADRLFELDNDQTWRISVRPPDDLDQLLADATCSVTVKAVGDEQGPDEPEIAVSVSAGLRPLGSVPEKGASTAEIRRLQIFNGACEVIARKGYGDASIRDIAKAAKVSVPTVYQYVENKEDLLYLITSTCMSDIIAYFENALNSDLAPKPAIVDAISAYLKYIDMNRKYINLVYSETRALSPENRQKIFHLEKRFLKLWEDILKRGIKSGDFAVADTDLTANFIYFLCTVWSLRFWSIGHMERDLVRDEITSMVLGGICPQ